MQPSWHRGSVRTAGLSLGLIVALLPRGRAQHAPSHPIPLCQPLAFEGEVRRGQRFEHAIGAGLRFSLEPVASGWVVRVMPATAPRPPIDMAELATPPFRSVSPLLLTTDFAFRAQDVIGWNPRNFHYLASPTQVPAATQAYRAAIATEHPTPQQQAAVARVVGLAPEAQLLLLDAQLVLGSGDQPRSASGLATRFGTTPHTILPGVAGPLGRLEWIRFRATFARSPANEVCRQPQS